jgi:hypothetical protein
MREAREMKYDAQLLADLIDDAAGGRKWFAYKTGMHVNTIQAYTTSRINIPIDFWRRAFALTHDPRIIDLLLGDVSYEVTFEDRLPDLATDTTRLTEVMDSMGKFHQSQTYLADILRDGRITETDAEAVKRYNHARAKFRLHESALHRAINVAFAESTTGARS